MRKEVTRLPNPLKTDRTTINAATPIVIPDIEINQMIVMKFTLCFETKYLLEMKDSKPISQTSKSLLVLLSMQCNSV